MSPTGCPQDNVPADERHPPRRETRDVYFPMQNR